MTAPELTVVLPAHNEQGLLELSVSEISKELAGRGQSFELIIVENGSSDRTLEIADRLSRELGEVRVLSLRHADYGRAIAKGIQQASAPVIVLFDVDYFDLGFLDRAVELLGRGSCGIVLASKRAPGSIDRRPLTRRLLTAAFSTCMQVVVGLNVSDAHGMKAFLASDCAEIARECVMGGSLFDVELVLRSRRAGVGVSELPVEVRELRPPRTPVLGRILEGAVGLLRLRLLLGREPPDT
ncbi:MAG: glycosyltransferase [Acidimicrobiales bacterium]